MDRRLPLISGACSLAPADLSRRLEEFASVFARALIAAERRGDGLRVRLRALDGVADEMRRLAGLESECCPFFRFAIDQQDDVLVDITASPHGAGALDELLALARAHT